MSLPGQALRLCAVAIALGVLLGVARGLPAVESAAPEAGSCHAPLGGFAANDAAVRWIAQSDARGLVGRVDVAFVDCRPRQQFEAGHVTGALHFEPSGNTVSGTLKAALAGATTVITYCDADHQCERSLSMAKQLTRAGLADVRVLEGGLPAWLEHGFPAESGTCQQCEATR